ncbi:MAG TPA: hypothetical protein VHO50_04695 [Bacteroidales bacterium]|nr:hypothetical protein [Bacteroidales bacterium]
MKKLLILCLVIVPFLASCKKDKGDPPVLPPLKSMTIDFSNFMIASKSDVSKSSKGENNASWEFAAKTSKLWIDIINVLYVPVSGFQGTIDQNPGFVTEKTWEWKYSTTEYDTRLKGYIGATEVEWELYISKKTGTNTFSDFLWIEGTSAFDGKSGQWTINESNSSASALITIDWEDLEGSIEKVTYTYVKNDVHKDDKIEYGHVTSGSYNAYIKNQYYDANDEKDYTVDIEWNTTEKNGRVKSAQWIGPEWYCWNSNKINVTCD